MAKIKIDFDKLNLTEEEKKKIEEDINDNKLSGCIKSPRSGCMLFLIIPLIISITIACLINFK
jgi:hypothetical protein